MTDTYHFGLNESMGNISENEAEQEISPIRLRVQTLGDSLTRAESVIAQWLQLNEASLLLETGASIASKTGTSEITVSRFFRRLGYKGMAGLKDELQSAATAKLSGGDLYLRLIDNEIGVMIRRDAEAVLAIGTQITRPEWGQAIETVYSADEVFVTGFQTVRGVAEDFARRLGIIRPSVRFVAAHESGLVEWIPDKPSRRCLVLIDTVPYAREAEPIVKLANKNGMSVVVVTEERNTWAAAYTPFVFFVVNKVFAYVESSGPLVSLLSLITHAVAAKNSDKANARLQSWPAILGKLQLF